MYVVVTLYWPVSIHQAMHATEEGEMKLLAPVDNNGNTIAHLAVERGQVSVFKVMIIMDRLQLTLKINIIYM